MKPYIVSLAALIALSISSLTSTSFAFDHPGIPLTASDQSAVKADLDREPWKSGYAILASDSHSQLGDTMQGPFAHVSRNPNINLNQWCNDMIAIWDLARMWYFTGDTRYTSWAVQANGAFNNLGSTAYIGFCVTSLVPGTLSTATFNNVSMTGGDGIAPVAASSAPLALCASPGDGVVPLRWAESYGATRYNVKRSTTSGGPYTTIARATNPSYVDRSVFFP